jgi:hypothetical protein
MERQMSERIVPSLQPRTQAGEVARRTLGDWRLGTGHRPTGDGQGQDRLTGDRITGEPLTGDRITVSLRGLSSLASSAALPHSDLGI